MKILKDEIPRDDCGMTPHHHAALNGDLNIFKALFEHFTDKSQQSNGVIPLYFAAEYGRLDICKFIIKNTSQLNLKYDSGHTPFHIVAQNGHLEVCKLLVKNMEEENSQNTNGETPLQIASENNQWKTVHYLIRANKLNQLSN